SSTTRKRVPLHRPRSGLKFLIIMIGTPSLSISLCGGIPLITSCSKKSPLLSSSTAPTDKYSWAVVGSRSETAALIRCTMAFVVVRMVR
ncbi:hypothetical protein PHYSODRAFT_391216, partial [Phytophthora sojae]